MDVPYIFRIYSIHIYIYMYIYIYVLDLFHIFSLVCFLIYGVNNSLWISKTDYVVFFKKEGCCSGGFPPQLELLGHAGHVHVQTFGSISHVSGSKLNC